MAGLAMTGQQNGVPFPQDAPGSEQWHAEGVPFPQEPEAQEQQWTLQHGVPFPQGPGELQNGVRFPHEVSKTKGMATREAR